MASQPSQLAQPSQKLAKKQRARQRLIDSEDEDLDDFIVDDEEEEEYASRKVDYDREEIWRIINRGKRRYEHFDDDDLSDMEATGSQVFAEERKSAAQARREDEMEQETIQRHAEEKKRRRAAK